MKELDNTGPVKADMTIGVVFLRRRIFVQPGKRNVDLINMGRSGKSDYDDR
jgi:hypothetical protein